MNKNHIYRQCHPDWLFCQEGSCNCIAISFINKKEPSQKIRDDTAGVFAREMSNE